MFHTVRVVCTNCKQFTKRGINLASNKLTINLLELILKKI
ncbi:MAG: hypothetical protein RL316_253 [Bacteroidota bacterium]